MKMVATYLFLKFKEVKAIGRELNLEEVRQDLAEAIKTKEMMVKILKLNHKQQLMTVMLLWLFGGGRGTNGGRKEGGEQPGRWRTLLLCYC